MDPATKDKIAASAENARKRYGDDERKIAQIVAKNTQQPVAKVREVLGFETPKPLPYGTASSTRRSATAPKKRNFGAVPVEKLIEDERLDAKKILQRVLNEDLEADQTVADEDLRRHCDISKEDWKSMREDPDFSRYRVRIRRNKRVIWCGAAARRQMLALDSVIED